MPVESELSRFSLLSFSQNFLAGVADRSCISLCFLAIRFHALVVIVTSNLPFLVLTGPSWALLCFWGYFGLFGTQRVSSGPFSAAASLLLASLTCSSSGGCTATEGLRAMCGPGRRSPLHLQQLRRTADTTFAASQMHLLSL